MAPHEHGPTMTSIWTTLALVLLCTAASATHIQSARDTSLRQRSLSKLSSSGQVKKMQIVACNTDQSLCKDGAVVLEEGVLKNPATHSSKDYGEDKSVHIGGEGGRCCYGGYSQETDECILEGMCSMQTQHQLPADHGDEGVLECCANTDGAMSKSIKKSFDKTATKLSNFDSAVALEILNRPQKIRAHALCNACKKKWSLRYGKPYDHESVRKQCDANRKDGAPCK